MRVVWSVGLLVVALASAPSPARGDDPPGRPGAPAAAEEPGAAQGSTTPTPQEIEAEKSALEEMLEGADDDAADPDGAQPPAPAAAEPPRAKQQAAPRPKAGGDKKQKRGEISDELVAGSAQPTPENPRQSQLANALRGSIYLSDSFTLNAGATLTIEGGAPPPQGSPFKASYGGTVAFFTIGADFDPGEHWTFSAHLDGSPSSQQLSSTSLSYQPVKAGAFETVDALLHTRSSSIGGGASFGYDTAGDSDFESAFSAGIGLNDLSSDERITQVEGRNGKPVLANDLRDYCRTNPTKCSKSLRAVLGEQTLSLTQARLNAAFTETLFLDTDLTVSGDYYVYSDDPTKLGFFSVATAGRTNVLGGGGVPIAPLQWALRPEIAHRFGSAFSARLWAQVGQYVEGGGQGTISLGLKLQYKFTRSFRMWLTLSGQRDIDIDGVESKTGMVGLGLALKL